MGVNNQNLFLPLSFYYSDETEEMAVKGHPGRHTRSGQPRAKPTSSTAYHPCTNDPSSDASLSATHVCLSTPDVNRTISASSSFSSAESVRSSASSFSSSASSFSSTASRFTSSASSFSGSASSFTGLVIQLKKEITVSCLLKFFVNRAILYR